MARLGWHGSYQKRGTLKTCPACRDEFYTAPSDTRIFCSRSCVYQDVLATVTCERCGAEKSVRHHLRTNLCKPCGKAERHRREHQRKQERLFAMGTQCCSACGSSYAPGGKCPCSRSRPGPRNRLRSCQWCGNDFRAATKAAGLFCAYACYLASVKSAAKCWSNTEKARLRRKGMTADPDRERVITKVVFERDGWRCHICRKKIGKSSGPLGQRPSLDHVVPLSKGGKHTYANCRAAHQSCNSGKSNKKPGQPLLIG